LAPIVAILRRLASHNAAISGHYRVEPDCELGRPKSYGQLEGRALIYRHTQRGTLILIACLAAAGFSFAAS